MPEWRQAAISGKPPRSARRQHAMNALKHRADLHANEIHAGIWPLQASIRDVLEFQRQLESIFKHKTKPDLAGKLQLRRKSPSIIVVMPR